MRQFVLQNRREIVNVLMTIAAAGVALLLATIAPKLGRRTFHRFERWCGRVARKPSRAVLFIAGVSFVLFISTIALTGIPQPRIHDEFSYLLAGEPFSHGRLTNPPIPVELVPYFETMHELMRPTFASKYFPAQGMTLALGNLLTGYPIVGVVLSTTAACAALVWALLGWIHPRRWILIGALVIVVHPIVIDWTTTYWGGSIAMLGGALVFGAIARLLRSFTIFNSLALAIGLAILFNSRPYEGALWSIAAGATLVAVSWRRRGFISRLLLPASAVLVLTAGWIAYYNYRVTADAPFLPDQLHTRQYMAVPRFYWSAPEPPKTYHNDAMRDHYDRYERDYFETQQTLRGWVTWFLGEKLYKFVKFY